jgi:succinate-semialdehyde dehydrogenase / glutarate-semialdehyde dehydrogenase
LARDAFVDDKSRMPLVSVNPATGRTLARYREHTPAQLDATLARALSAFTGWRELAISGRISHLRKLGRTLRQRRQALAALITAEVGKPIAQARAEIEKCAVLCDYAARHGPRALADERPTGAPRGASVAYEPLGPILAIMPWNFPFWQVFRAGVPALLAGNVVVLKHASNVCGCAQAIEECFSAAGFPRGVFQSILASSKAAARLIADERVRGVTLTGSTEAGRTVAEAAGRALKPTVFELGGSDPYLILHDADIAKAAEICAEARLVNAGQSCVAAKRFIVVESVRAEFERALVAAMAKRNVGNPTDEATQVGPLARADLRQAVHRQVRASVRRGARILLGGKPLPGDGFFYEPTVLTHVRAGMPAYDEELFGPVAAIIPAQDEEAAIRVANDTPYGLGAAIFTRDRRRGETIARERIDAGMVFVNDAVRSDVTLPFGGTKASGLGRELSAHGFRAFVNIKTLLVRG